MSMDIKRTRGPAGQGNVANKKTKGAKGSAGAKASGGLSKTRSGAGASGSEIDATVSLTGQAARLQELEAQIADLPVVDVARVASVQNELSNGTHKIDAPRVADKIISSEISLTMRKS